MPVDAVSLYGFMAESEAISYLEDACILERDADPSRLWSDARAKLGRATPRAGLPEIRPIPTNYKARLDALRAEPWFQQFFGGTAWDFALVEIGPLIAPQVQVTVEHSDAHCAAVGSPPSMGQLLALCLPRDRKPPDIRIDLRENGLVVSSPDLNVSAQEPLWAELPSGGPLAGAVLTGPVLGTRVPTVQVGKFNGRYYLRNGYHRLYCSARKGATHAPCAVIEFETLGHAIGGMSAFGSDLLESDDPPTLSHFIEGRASDVQVYRVHREIMVTWTESTLREAL